MLPEKHSSLSAPWHCQNIFSHLFGPDLSCNHQAWFRSQLGFRTVSGWTWPICPGTEEFSMQTNSVYTVWSQGKRIGHSIVQFTNAVKIYSYLCYVYPLPTYLQKQQKPLMNNLIMLFMYANSTKKHLLLRHKIVMVCTHLFDASQ